MNVLAQTVIDWLAKPAELPEGLVLRQLEPGDRRRLQAVVDDWWGRPMGALLPRPFFSCFCDTSFVLERDGDLVAFLIGFLSQSHPDEAYIHAVGVAPEWRGQGLGRLLYQRFADVTRRHGRRRLRAITAPVNTGSLAFHLRLGFAITMPADAGEDGRAELVLELPPQEVDVDRATANETAAALRTPLEGNLVVLEPLARGHAKDLAAAAAASDWSLMPSDAATPEGFADWLDRMLATSANSDPRDPRAAFAVVRRDSGRAVGSSSFHSIYPEHRRVEIGMTWYARDQWGSGANIEAKLLMLERAFAIGFRRVEFKTDAANERSRRALEAMPAKFEGVFCKHMLVRDGERRDSAYYSVIDDDWPRVRANLERRLAMRRDRQGEQVRRGGTAA
jgi:RimJ/RimL family protein N-acetyltransferase